MENLNFAGIILGFLGVFENIPDAVCYACPSEDKSVYFEDICKRLFASMHETMTALLKRESFVLVKDTNGSYVRIFNTDAERDSFIAENPNGDNATPIDYYGFLDYAKKNEFVLPCYLCKEEGNIVLFKPQIWAENLKDYDEED